MKLLIVYGTTEGQTRKICQFLKEEAEKLHHTVDLCDATEHPFTPSTNFDAIIIGASVHMHKYQSAIEHYVKDHLTMLNKIPSAFVSVSLTAASDDEVSWHELEAVTEDFLDHTGWKPGHVTQVAGALRYTKYDFFKKFIVRLIAKKAGRNTDTSQDYEYTDWNKVKGFLKKILEISQLKTVQTISG
jgi:menaquinone-dependent protoporphyrinogen oxidase